MTNPLDQFRNIVAIKNDLRNAYTPERLIDLYKAIEELEYILQPNKVFDWILSLKPVVFPKKNGLKELCEHDWTNTNIVCSKCKETKPNDLCIHYIDSLSNICVFCGKNKHESR